MATDPQQCETGRLMNRRCSSADLTPGWLARPVRHLYIHVPFCASKCSYCAFYSEATRGELVERYLRALLRELELVADELSPETIFFGGGTPTILNCRQWERVLRALRHLFPQPPLEWSVEANPATLGLDKARLLRDHGVNRISLGVQSLDADLLERLGRVHSREMAFRAYDLLRRAGFENVGLDLMFAIPGQSLESWKRTLTEALAMGPEHISCYEVIYEEDTPLYAQLQAGRFEVDEDLACDMYEALLAAAQEAGFTQYEVANFGRGPLEPPGVPQRACRHNIAYWRGRPFHGLGPSACGLVDGVRTRNVADTRAWCEALEGGRRAIESRDELSPLARAAEIAGFGFRMNIGWGYEEFREVTGVDLRQLWAAELAWLEQLGWGESAGRRFRLTAEGLRFADQVIERFLRIEDQAEVVPG